jgi:nitronate monooxygenase
VYHDITDRKWAEKAVASGVHGLICVNRQAGGHAGQLSSQNLYDSLKSFGLPLIAAGGCSTHQDYTNLLKQGYAGVQMGTRFIVSNECNAHADYKAAILKASADDVVLTDKISGVPVSVIKTPYIERIGTKASPLARYLLQNPKTKHYMRMFYTLRAAFRLKEASLQGSRYQDYWQAGKSVEGCSSVLSAHDIIQSLVKPKP